jgi:hypothetical protein
VAEHLDGPSSTEPPAADPAPAAYEYYYTGEEDEDEEPGKKTESVETSV